MRGHKRGHYAKTGKYSKLPSKEAWESDSLALGLYQALSEPLQALEIAPDCEAGLKFRREIAEVAYDLAPLDQPPQPRIGKAEVSKLLNDVADSADKAITLLNHANKSAEVRFSECATRDEAVGAVIRSSLWQYFENGMRANFDSMGDNVMGELPKLLSIFRDAIRDPDFGGLPGRYFDIADSGGRPQHPKRKMFVIQTVLALSDCSGKTLYESGQDVVKFAKVYRGLFGLSLQDTQRFILQVVSREFDKEKPDPR